MQIKDLSPATLAVLKKMRYDQITNGKHEGPETWDWLFKKDDPNPRHFMRCGNSITSVHAVTGERDAVSKFQLEIPTLHFKNSTPSTSPSIASAKSPAEMLNAPFAG